MNSNAPVARPAGRTASYDIARGTAVIMVVFMHISERMATYLPAPHLIGTVNWALAAGRMPILLLISGALASGYLGRAADAIGRRVAHFLWLLILWVSIGTAFDSLLFREGTSLPWLISEIVLPRHSVLWFIWGLALFTATIPLVRTMPRAVVLAVALAIATIARMPIFSPQSADLLMKVVYHAPFFYAGLLYRNELDAFLAANPRAKLAMLTAALIVTHGMEMACLRVVGWEVLGNAERAIVCLLGLLVAGEIAKTRLGPVMQWFGRNTLPIFVTHPLALAILFALQIRGNFALTAMAATAVTVAACLLIERCALVAGGTWLYRLPEIPLPAWMRIGSGPASRLKSV